MGEVNNAQPLLAGWILDYLTTLYKKIAFG
jgi:hypothetical protein